jgi:hypothetical protein
LLAQQAMRSDPADSLEHYTVLVDEGETTSAPCIAASRARAWQVTGALRAAGKRVYIMRLDTDPPLRAVGRDEPLPEIARR